MNLFAYGTLAFPQIMAKVTGVKATPVPAFLDGYVRFRVKGHSFPAVIESHDTTCEGVLYRNVPDAAWKLLDEFESDFYQRREVTVKLAGGSSIKAMIYVTDPSHRDSLTTEPWYLSEHAAEEFLDLLS